MEYKRIGKTRKVHRVVAETALGRPLPKGAEVHHVDGNKQNNANSNLVICQDRAYHFLLHERMRIKANGGDPNIDRYCSRCNSVKQVEHFYYLDRHGDWCRQCSVGYQRMRRAGLDVPAQQGAE